MDRWTKLLYCIALLFVYSFGTNFGEVVLIDDGTETPAKVTLDSALYVTTGGDTSFVKIADTAYVAVVDTAQVRVMDTANVITIDFIQRVANGEVPGYSLERKFGSIASVQASTPADIWAYGITSGAEIYTWSDTGTADIDRISSDNSLDTGVHVIIWGLDAVGDLVEQTVILDGADAQTPVALTTSLWRINRAENANGRYLLGNVYVFVNGATSGGEPTDPTNVRAYLPIRDQGTMQLVYTVPAGKTACVYGLEVSLTKAGGATPVGGEFLAKTRSYGKVFRTRDEFQLLSSGSSSRTAILSLPVCFPEKTDFVGNVNVTANGVGATWAISILLKDN